MATTLLLPLEGGGERRALARPGRGWSPVGTGDHPHPPREAARVASPLQGEEL